MFKVIIVAVIVTIAGLFVLSKMDPNNNTSGGVDVNSQYTGDDAVNVTITGQILHPGSYDCSPQQTLGDLINMAGGVLENADPDSYISGLLIGTRTSFYISKKADIPDTCIVENIKKININTCDSIEAKEAGFSSSQAEGLVNYRQENGEYQTLEDIMKVSGIGEKTYLAVRDKICLS